MRLGRQRWVLQAVVRSEHKRDGALLTGLEQVEKGSD